MSEEETKKQNPDCPGGGITHHPSLDNFHCPGQEECEGSSGGSAKPPKCVKNEPCVKKPPIKHKEFECNIEEPAPKDPCAQKKKKK